MNIQPARRLTAVERALLDLLLAPDFPGAERLRAQARNAVVVGCCDCGCPTVDLAVPTEVPAAAVGRRLVPCEGEVTPTNSGAADQIIVFADAGRLSRLEYVYFDEPPTAWPDPSRVRVHLRL